MDSIDSSKTVSSIDWTDEESVGDTSSDEMPVQYLTDYIPWINNISNNLATGSCDRDYFAKSFTEHLLEIDRVPWKTLNIELDDNDWGRPLRQEKLLSTYQAFGNTLRKFADGTRINARKTSVDTYCKMMREAKRFKQAGQSRF